MRGRRRRWIVLGAAACAAAGLLQLAAGSAGQEQQTAGDHGSPSDPAEVQRGRGLFVESCSSCHGFDARGVENEGPSLIGAGAGAADFYLSTGRMPLEEPGDQPLRSEPLFDDDEIDALVAYVGSLGGPPVPDVDISEGSITEGLELFTSFCAGCHTVSGEGGVVTDAFAPKLTDATPTQVAEAIRTGPYVMPAFTPEEITDDEVNSIARYVEEQGVKKPDNRGGWGIGRLGPVPEGLVAWLLAAAALLLVARLIGDRGEDDSR